LFDQGVAPNAFQVIINGDQLGKHGIGHFKMALESISIITNFYCLIYTAVSCSKKLHSRRCKLDSLAVKLENRKTVVQSSKKRIFFA